MTLLQSCPEKFESHKYEKKFLINYPAEAVWDVIMRQSTFTDTQVWPFRVEFDRRETYMKEGVANIHHGPLLLFAGEITEIKPLQYRDLQYYMGSYFGSMRLIRPARLQIKLESEGDNTILTIALTSFVKPWITGTWNSLLGLFWSNFGRWINGYIRKYAQRDQKLFT